MQNTPRIAKVSAAVAWHRLIWLVSDAFSLRADEVPLALNAGDSLMHGTNLLAAASERMNKGAP